jgi:hypothetical protein
MTKLTVTFRNVANLPKNEKRERETFKSHKWKGQNVVNIPV